MVCILLFSNTGRGLLDLCNLITGYELCDSVYPTDDDLPINDISLNDLSNIDKTQRDLVFKYNQLCEQITRKWQRDFVIPVRNDHIDSVLESDLGKRPFVVFFIITDPQKPASASFYKLLYNRMNVPIVHILLDDTNDLKLKKAVKKAVENLKDLIRPPWDVYFMSLARLAEMRSNCMKRRVGAILIDGATMTILSTGYNGTPRNVLNCNQGGCPRCNATSTNKCGEVLDQCICLHAEENAIVMAQLSSGSSRMNGPSKLTLYCTTKPCLGCSKLIVQAGIKRVVWERDYKTMHDPDEVLFRQAGVISEQLVSDGHGGMMHRFIQTSKM